MRHSRRNQVKYLVGGVGELGPSLKGRGVIRERQQSGLQERGFRYLVRSYQGGRVGKTGRELWKNLISSKEKKMKGRKNIFTLSPDFKPCYQLLGQ